AISGWPWLLAVAEIVVGRKVDARGRGEPAIAAGFAQSFDLRLPARYEAHDAPGTGRPIACRNSTSPSADGFGAVSSLSPKKIELAPARKQSACSSRLMRSRPALRRTRDLGKASRAIAISRTSCSGSTGGASASGVPAIGTRQLIGTLSGGVS